MRRGRLLRQNYMFYLNFFYNKRDYFQIFFLFLCRIHAEMVYNVTR